MDHAYAMHSGKFSCSKVSHQVWQNLSHKFWEMARGVLSWSLYVYNVLQ